MHPYLSHCGLLPHSRKGMGEVSQHHYLRSFPTIDRMCSSAGDPTLTTPTGLGNPLQEQPYCQPSPKDEMDQLQQGRDCGFTIQQKKSTHVNTCLPLEAIKGEPGFTTKVRSRRHTHTLPSHSSTEQRSPLCPPLSWDLGLSPLSQPACTPYHKHLWVQGYTESTATLDVGHSWPEPV